MAQLKSFKYVEQEGSSGADAADTATTFAANTPNDAPQSVAIQMPNVAAEQQQQQDTITDQGQPAEQSPEIPSEQQQASLESSSTSSSSDNGGLTIGGNLTASSSSTESSRTNHQLNTNSDSLSSSEEYQVARVDLNDDEDDQKNRISVNLNDNAQKEETNKSLPLGDVDSEERMATRILEESEDTAQPQQTPKTPRPKLFQGRVVTLSNSNNSPALSGSSLAANRSRSPVEVKRGAMSPTSIRSNNGNLSAGAGDETSQFSFSQHATKSASNQFEIRWQNLRLFSRKTNLPRFVYESSFYQFLYKEKESQLAADTCYSPPIQHRVFPTIKEESEHQPAGTRNAQSDKFDSSISLADKENIGQKPATDQSNEFKCILDNVSGSVFSGQLTAILGPSGVGKTTLLNSLTGRNTLDGTGRVSLIGGATKRMSVVTVPQNDVLPTKLTTWEDLSFTSRLKNPQFSEMEHKNNIEKIVEHLHMTKFLHTQISRLSGGEARRLSIGRELLNSPDIMILDEPTSGLDANTCKKIITALRDIVEHSDNILGRPMSIIVTIHQPQQEVYNLFQRVYVMAIGGRSIYEGPPNMLLPTLLQQSSLSRMTPVDQLNENPAIVAIEVASGEYGQEIIQELADFHELQMYEEFSTFNDEIGMASPIQTPYLLRNPRKSPLVGAGVATSPRLDVFHRKRLSSFDSSIGRPTPIMLRRNNLSGNQLDKMSAITSVSYASTYDAELPKQTGKLKVDKRLRRSVVMKSDLVSHTLTLMSRCWLLATRDIFLMSIRIIGFLLVAGGTVQIFSHALDPDQHICPQYESEVENLRTFMHDIKDRLNEIEGLTRQSSSQHLFFFHLLLCITMVTSALTGLVFPFQMRMFIREYKNGWYSPASFVISQTLAELPIDVVGPLVTVLISYPLCNQPTSQYYWREIGYCIVIIFTSIITKSQAQVIGAFLMDSVENSVFMSCVFVTFPALLSGVPIRVQQMTLPLQWASYTSFLRYSFESLLDLRYGYGMCPCDPELVDGYPIDASSVAIPSHLNNLARGFMALNGINQTAFVGEDAAILSSIDRTTSNPLDLAGGSLNPIDATPENLFLRFIRLVTGAGNFFAPNSSDLGDCDKYRSLYLLIMNVPKDVLDDWLIVMLLMFIISRFIIYFVVKTVIKIRRQ